jgi:hypothetical protein
MTIDYIKSKLECRAESGELDICDTYGEPGYEVKEGKLIYLGNWNGIERIAKALEDDGNEIEWADEWFIDHEESRCFRIQPDSYNWTQSFVITDVDQVICKEDLENYPQLLDDYIEYYLLNNPNRVDLFCVDLASKGFTELEDIYRNGWYGKEDSPSEIYEKLSKEYDVIFQINYAHMWEISFTVWVKKIEE